MKGCYSNFDNIHLNKAQNQFYLLPLKTVAAMVSKATTAGTCLKKITAVKAVLWQRILGRSLLRTESRESDRPIILPMRSTKLILNMTLTAQTFMLVILKDIVLNLCS